MVAMQLFQAAPAAVSVQTEQSLRALSAEVVRALDLLQGPRVQRLYQLQTSRRYGPPEARRRARRVVLLALKHVCWGRNAMAV